MFDRNLMKLEGMHAIMAALVVLALLQAATIAGQALTLSSVIASLWEGAAVEQQIQGIAAFFACFAVSASAAIVIYLFVYQKAMQSISKEM